MTSTPGTVRTPSSGHDVWASARSASSSLGRSSLGRSSLGGPANTSMGTPGGAGPSSRPRKSALPDFGTPIKVASSSPYRTPESTSKASILLSKTPFGTPAKGKAAPIVAASGLSSTPSNPYGGAQQSAAASAAPGAAVKPVTSTKAHALALAKSVYDGGAAYAALALQARPYLPYSSLAKTAMRANWFRMAVMMLAAHHVLMCVAQLSPAHPIFSITIFVRPSAIVFSLLSYMVLAGVFAAYSSHPLSITKAQWADTSRLQLQDTRLGSFTLPSSSPANIAALRLAKGSTWRAIALHATFGLFLALLNLASLAYYSDTPTRWSPYHSVPVRLPGGQKSFALRPNERFFFILGANTTICAIAALLRSTQTSHPGKATGTPFCMPKFDAQASFSSPLSRTARSMKREFRRPMLLAVIGSTVILQAYLIFRRPVFRLILSIIGHHSPLRPLLVPSFRRPFFSAELATRTALLHFASVMLLEFFNVAWEVCASQSIDCMASGVSKFAREPTRCLIRGMQLRTSASAEEGAAVMGAIERDFIAHSAFAEMALVASTDFQRRSAIFRDVAGGSNSTLATGSHMGANARSAWTAIASECLTVLKEERQWIEDRGRAPVDTPTAVSAAVNTSSHAAKTGQDAHKISIASATDAVKARPASIWDKLASSASVGSPATAIQSAPRPSATPSPATSSAVDQSQTSLHSLLHRIAPPVSSGTAQSSPPQSRPAPQPTRTRNQEPNTTPATLFFNALFGSARFIVSVGRTILHSLPSDLQHVLTQSSASRFLFSSARLFLGQSQTKVESAAALIRSGVLPNDAALATWSVQTLSALLAASLDQDEYGTVALSAASQCGIDDIMEAFALLLIALQDLAEDLGTSLDSKESSDVSAESKTASTIFEEVLGPLMMSLRTGITLVIGVFEPVKVALRPASRQLVDKALRNGLKNPEMAEKAK